MKKFLPLIFLTLFSFCNLSAQDVLMQDATVNQCTGNFYDSGDATGDHATDTQFTLTICPDAADQYVELDFSAFDLGAGSTMTIYNGDTADPNFEFGQFTGTDSPDDIRATTETATGCLTIVFDAGNTPGPGWEAEISCSGPDVYGNQAQTSGTYTQCTGMFYDNGGPNSTYGQEFLGTQVYTFCSDDPDLITELNFTQFLLFTGDEINIYDGDSTNAPLIDTYVGPGGPGLVFASPSNTSGCLTVEWVPDGGFSPGPGWTAEIGCREPCQLITADVALDPAIELGPGNFEVAVNQEVTYSANAVFEDSDVDATYEWEFQGNPGVVTGETVDFEFNSTGIKTVTLIITDAEGCELEVELQVNVVFYAVDVDATTYTIPELVEDVLIDNPCAQISNITWSVGSDFGFSQSAAYFDKNNSSFPIDYGLIMSSGSAVAAEGPNGAGNQGEGGDAWPGDPDLLSIAQGIPGVTTNETNNATIIEFDFLSFSNQMTFNFLFAAEEYGTFQCGFSDVFAFLLTDSNGNTVNVAVVPGTTDPVAVTTVRDDQYNGGCPSSNVQYFDSYYGGGGLDPNTAPINFMGNTVVMTASSAITPGESYHMKLAIADANDSIYDSAIFLEGGSFDVGSVDLGEDILADSPTPNSPSAICEGGSYALELDLTPIPGVEITWLQDGVVIPGETGTTLQVDEEGTYTVEFVYNPDNEPNPQCISTDDIVVEFLPTPLVDGEAPDDIFACSTAGSGASFDLTLLDTQVLNGQDPDDFIITYYESLQNAEDGNNPIADPTDYAVASDCVDLFVRIEGAVNTNLTGCYKTYMFEACVGDINVGDTMEDLFAGDPNNDGIGIFDLTENDEEAVGTLDPNEYDVFYFETQDDADNNTNEITDPTAYENDLGNPQEIFVRIQSSVDSDCFASNGSFFVEALTCNANIVADDELCGDGINAVSIDLTETVTTVLGAQDEDDYTVTFYETQDDADNETDNITTPDNYELTNLGDYEVFIRVENDLVDDCYNVTSFTISVTTAYVGSNLQDLTECDGNGNSVASFDLTVNDAAALDGQDPSQYSVSYHGSQDDADNGVAVPDATQFPNSQMNPQTVYVRVENDDNPGCYAVGSFQVEANPSGTIEQAPEDIFLCNNGLGNGTVDLTQNDALVLGPQDPAIFSVSYHATQAAADAGTPEIDPDPANYVPQMDGQQVFVRVENSNFPDCYNTAVFTLEVADVSIGTVTDKEECDTGGTGVAVFDLTESDIEALDGQSPQDYTVTYHLSQADADNGVAIADAQDFENTASNPQIIYVRVSFDESPDCYLTTSFEVEATPSAEIFDPSPLQECDTDNDGFFTEFYPSDKDGEITGNTGGITVTYHGTQSDADNGLNELGEPYTNVVAYNQTIYVRTVDQSNGCVKTTTLQLEVYDSPAPVIEEPEALSLCDDGNGDGQTFFDLTQVEDEVLNGLDPDGHIITYHDSEAAAEAGTPAISGPGNYLNQTAQQTVWVRVEETGSPAGCYGVVPLDLEVFPLPDAVQPEPLTACDDLASGSDTDEQNIFDLTVKDGEVTGGDNTLTVTWYETPADQAAGTPIADPTAYQNTVANPQTVVAEVTDGQGCSDTVTLTLEVYSLPSPTPADQLDPYIICDDDNDGFAEFDLSELDIEVANGEANVSITYYGTADDAEGGLPGNELDNPYTNVSPFEQVIYARSTKTDTGCYRFVEVTLEVAPLPEIDVDAEDLSLYECDGDGDGAAVFDLTQNNAPVYGSQDTGDYTLTYHESQADADSGDDPIGNPSVYSNGGVSPLTVWVRLEDNDTGCYRTASFELEAGDDAVVAADPDQLDVCDDTFGSPTDTVGEFDLTLANGQITGGDDTLEVTYYESVADLNAGNAIADPTSYQNTLDNPQTLQVLVTGDNGCPATTTLTLNVNANPSLAAELDPLEDCDGDNDGVVEFDLESATQDILNGEPNVGLTYHLTFSDADLGNNPIDTTEPYQMVNGATQTVYVRAENSVTGCRTVGELELISTASPDIQGELEDLYICDDDSANGFAVFDLTQNEPNIFGSLDPSGYTVTYHTGQADAEIGEDPIAVPTMYTNTSNPQTIYVRLEDNATGCIDTFGFNDDNSFTLNVNALPPLVQPTPLSVCNDDYENQPFAQAEFDLTEKEGEIFGGVPAVPDNYVFTYYASLADLNAGNAIADPTAYENALDNPQTIYIVVEDSGNDTLCSDMVTLTIQVRPLPSPEETNMEDLRQEQCDEDNDGIALDPFDLTLSGAMIAGDENVDLFYYRTETAAELADPSEEITNPTAYINEPAYNELDANGSPTNVQVIYVRVESGSATNDCFVVVPFEIVVQPEPVLNNGTDDFAYTLCSDGTGGATAELVPSDIAGNLYFYDGGNGDPTALVPLLDPSVASNGSLVDYTVTYHLSEQDAEDGVNPVPLGYAASDGEVLYIRVEHTGTGCYNVGDIGQVTIEVSPRPSIDVLAGAFIDGCSNDEGGDTVTVDLTQFDGDIDNNPNGQNDPDTEVVYYASEADYDSGNPIANPGSYEATDGQVIYAEVIFTDTLCPSVEAVEIPVTVGTRPAVDLSGYDGAVICSDADPSTEVIGGDYGPLEVATGLEGLGYTFEWTYEGATIAESGPSITVGGNGNPLQAGDYTVTVTDPSVGCTSDVESFTIDQGNPPEFLLEQQTLGFAGEHSVMVTNVSGAGDYEFSIDNGPWVPLGADGTVTFDGLSAGEHIVVGRDRDGCGATRAAVSFIDYPAFFTPNGDGYNDRWNIIGLDTPENRGALIYIFDRYGKLLKQLSPSAPGWDGTYNGNILPSGDYWFRVEYTEPATGNQSEFKGHFTMKR